LLLLLVLVPLHSVVGDPADCLNICGDSCEGSDESQCGTECVWCGEDSLAGVIYQCIPHYTDFSCEYLREQTNNTCDETFICTEYPATLSTDIGSATIATGYGSSSGNAAHMYGYLGVIVSLLYISLYLLL